MSKNTLLNIGSPRWVNAIVARVTDELPYEEDNQLIAKAVRHYLEQDLSRCHEFIGTTIIEENYFEELN
ncbi:MAG: hypothetical protein JRJ77_15055 [Deltaproteobacteria bacterium]|nr:hypothetical protein [Deltaproteobacteria bacterium]